jgi:hypothetical protein
LIAVRDINIFLCSVQMATNIAVSGRTRDRCCAEVQCVHLAVCDMAVCAHGSGCDEKGDLLMLARMLCVPKKKWAQSLHPCKVTLAGLKLRNGGAPLLGRFLPC